MYVHKAAAAQRKEDPASNNSCVPPYQQKYANEINRDLAEVDWGDVVTGVACSRPSC